MRGQTTLDFALGISIFLVVIFFVFTFVPGLLDPFALNEEEDTVLVGQIADRLSQDTLGDPAEPYILDRSCTVKFFNNSTSNSGCGFSGNSTHELLNIPQTKDANVTIERNSTVGSAGTDILCWNATSEKLTSDDSCDGTKLSLGDSPTANNRNPSTITARRVVSLNGEDVTLKVVVW
ncbi:DUF7287 family protein [Salinibaculum rarum]|uniref:DUF7287 family protein n=1 Tax=Salinibaculum rarum TaxID=3058903 RepID=UPI00265D745A|nr:hypothetical protein [Salinibaculum sp. KK48]